MMTLNTNAFNRVSDERISAGPTTDFVVGRWFQIAAEDGYEKILRSIDEDKYKDDEEFQALAARKLYFAASCDALGR